MIIIDALQVPARYSGVGRQVLSIGAQLQDLPSGLELEVRCAADVRPVLEGAFKPGTTFRTPIRRSRPRVARIAYQQVMAPLRDAPDTLLVALGDQGPVWGKARVLLVVNDVRRLAFPESSPRLESSYYKLLVPRAIRHAASVATISEFSRAEIGRLFGDDLKVQVVADHPPPQVSVPGGSPGGHLLVVGALREYKGIEAAIDALALLPADGRPELVLAGPEERRGEMLRRRAEERGVSDRVRILGWVEEPLLEELYSGAAATVNPSTYEGYGFGVAESLARGLPTLASDIPPHREVGGDAPLYFPPTDSAALASAVELVRTDGALRAALAERALARSVELTRTGPTWRDVILDAMSP